MRIEINDLCKKIKNNTVLNHINLQLEGAKIYGIAGVNGSGKTMLFRCLAGLVKPTTGEILYDGKILYKDIFSPSSMGVVIENMGLYPEFTGFANLKYLAGIKKAITDAEIRSAIARVGLDPYDKRKVGKYSLGMRQRIVLAQAFMEKPDILLLDEPTNALDEKGVNLIRTILREEAARGALVMITSHNKDDLLYLCNEVFYMADGHLEVQK